MGILDKFYGEQLVRTPAGLHSATIQKVEYLYSAKSGRSLFCLYIINDTAYTDSNKQFRLTTITPEEADPSKMSKREYAVLNMWAAISNVTDLDKELIETFVIQPKFDTKKEWEAHVSEIDFSIFTGKKFYFKFTPYRKKTTFLPANFCEDLIYIYHKDHTDKGFLNNVKSDVRATNCSVWKNRKTYKWMVNYFWSEKLNIILQETYMDAKKPTLELVKDPIKEEFVAIPEIELEKLPEAWNNILG